MIAGPRLPFNRAFYERLAADHALFPPLSRVVVPKNTGYGFRVLAGQTFRFEMISGAQILDVDLFAADDPTETFHAPTQLWLEGGRVTTLTRIWGGPPRTRPLATVIADRISFRDIGSGYRDHKCYGAHCNPHAWILFRGSLPNTCYDNLRTGCAMLGLPQRAIHDNLNLYMKAALNPSTGHHMNVTSDAVPGDYLQFYAETELLVVVSLCPYGDGSVVPEDWATTPVPQHPVAIELADSGLMPQGWPYRP